VLWPQIVEARGGSASIALTARRLPSALAPTALESIGVKTRVLPTCDLFEIDIQLSAVLRLTAHPAPVARKRLCSESSFFYRSRFAARPKYSNA